MYLELTLSVASDSPQLAWAKAQENPYLALGHVGTHLDTYEKSHILLEYFKSQAILFDVRGQSEVQPETIALDRVQPGDFVLFRTGRMETFGYGAPEYFQDHPQLSQPLIDALIAKQVRFIGVDCPGIRQNDQHEAADRRCEQHGIYVIENLSQLDQLDACRFCIYTFWMEEERLTGLRCRVIAQLDRT